MIWVINGVFGFFIAWFVELNESYWGFIAW